MHQTRQSMEDRALKMMSSDQVEQQELGISICVENSLRGPRVLDKVIDVSINNTRMNLNPTQSSQLTNLLCSFREEAVAGLIARSNDALSSGDYVRGAVALSRLQTVLYYGEARWTSEQRAEVLSMLPKLGELGGQHGLLLQAMLTPDLFNMRAQDDNQILR